MSQKMIQKMSQKHERRVKIKKYQDSQSEKHSQSDQDDTQIQIQGSKRSESNYLKSEDKIEFKPKPVAKKQENVIKKSEPSSQLKLLKKQEEDQREQNLAESKLNYIKSIKYSDQEDEKDDGVKKEIKKPSYSKSKLKRIRKNERMDEMYNRANQLIELLNQAYESDVELYKNRKPADKKLRCFQDVAKQLKQVDLARQFIGLDGIELFINWLLPNEETGQETSLTVKIWVMNLLLELNVSKDEIENNQDLERLIRKYQKSKFQSLRDPSQQIISKWKLIKAIQNN